MRLSKQAENERLREAEPEGEAVSGGKALGGALLVGCIAS
jgi:hypothetical protein